MTCLASESIDTSVTYPQLQVPYKSQYYNMSSPAQSPRETEEVEPNTPTQDENETQQQEGQNEMSRDDIGLGYDFEVKEQDRWLPIANGE